ncbi:MAG: hypothetical protein LUH19_03815 [Lachnospiraceae bacterium]|nr:hypothetical protein [Lachnospiraceae bacterium]
MALSDDLVQIQRMKHVYQMEQRSQELVQQRQQMEQQQQIEQQAPALVQNMEVDAQIEQAPPQAQEVQNRRPSKKQRERQRADERALRQKEQADAMEAGLLEQRRSVSESLTMTPEQIENEKALRKQREKAISDREKADLLKEGLSETDKRRIKYEAQQERAALVGEYARMLPVNTKIRRDAMKEKEKEELKASELKKAYKVMQLPPAERAREEATISRHAKYDMLKKIFRDDNPLSHEDATWTNPVNGHVLINVGRAHMGGTKPMYIFEDREEPVISADGQITGYKQYLFKEAVNCIGRYKPEGALVTEAAASLQDALCGPFSIPAFAAEITEDGKTRVLGSFQEKIDLMNEAERVDLFAWQADPQNNLTEQIKNEILREHTLDWLLCNFDTKGENFLHRPDGHLSSFDKEASFGKIKDTGAEHMSTDYKPHANDTLYNTVFDLYAKGVIDLDLNANLPQIQIVENMTDEQYMARFDKMLDHKYGAASPQNTARQDVADRILRRKRGLRAEYQRFYTELTEKHNQARAAAGGQQPAQGGAGGQEAAPA